MAHADILKPLAQLAVVLIGLSAFLIFRYTCMSNDNNTVVASYCTEDNNARAIVSAIFTVVVYFIGVSLIDAMNAFRIFMLERGINEGVFIAFGQNADYRARSLRTKWATVVIALILIQYGPGSVQFISNLTTHSVTLFAKNNSTVLVTNITYGTSYPVIDRDIYIANLLLPLLRNYASSARSNVVPDVLLYGIEELDIGKDALGISETVETNVTRNNLYLGAIIDTGDSYSNNYIMKKETHATVTTQCVSYPNNDTSLPNNVSYSKTLNDTSIRNAYISKYSITNKMHVLSNSESHITNNNGTVIGGFSFCNSTVRFFSGDIIYNIDTQAIERVISSDKDTVLDQRTMGKYIENITMSPESAIILEPNTTQAFLISIGYVTGIQGNGLFDLSQQNIMHARICASVELAFSLLWKVDTSSDIIQFGFSHGYIPAHNAIIQAYMHGWVAWILACTLASIMLFIFTAYITSLVKSPIDIKETNELTLVDNLSISAIENRRSNNKQPPDSFERELRVRDGNYAMRENRRVIYYA